MLPRLFFIQRPLLFWKTSQLRGQVSLPRTCDHTRQIIHLSMVHLRPVVTNMCRSFLLACYCRRRERAATERPCRCAVSCRLCWRKTCGQNTPQRWRWNWQSAAPSAPAWEEMAQNTGCHWLTLPGASRMVSRNYLESSIWRFPLSAMEKDLVVHFFLALFLG